MEKISSKLFFLKDSDYECKGRRCNYTKVDSMEITIIQKKLTKIK